MHIIDVYNHSQSQAHQDFFAALVNNFEIGGFFLDLGSNEPRVCNNSFLLEKLFHWNGVLVDYTPELVQRCREQRRAKAVQADLNIISPTQILDDYFSPKVIDYLSLDLDGDATKTALQNLDFNKYKIKCMTFEHDAYIRGGELRDFSRKFIADCGLKLICKDVKFNGWDFEDWYVSSELVNMQVIDKIVSEGKCHSEIFKTILNEY